MFFIRFLLCFFILYVFFPFYRGLTAAGGKLYVAFLDNHFNLIKGFTSFLTGVARFILEALHYTVHQSNYHTLRIGYRGGISVNPSCLGWAVMSFWVAFVFANRGGWKRKSGWMLTGIFFICLINIARIVLITISIHRHWRIVTSLDQHLTFNIFSYGCIFILMYLYTRSQKSYEGIKLNNQQNNKLITL